ncbi:MAG: 7TM-DISM domain-containing protein [Pseudomonas sp.]|uniref:hybrid sensor histidine kinase/response regulator n=1 Tax=Pseudomonas sp. TaxID=306 RepID=UPI003390B684
MRAVLRWGLLLVAVWGLSLGLAAAPRACSVEQLELTPWLHVFEDPTARLTAQQLMALPEQRFQTSEAARRPEGYSRSAYWFRLTLDNPLASDCSRWLSVGDPRLEDIQVHVWQAGTWRVMRAGSRYPLQAWAVPLRQPLFALNWAPGERIELAVRVASTSLLPIQLQLWSTPAALANRQSGHMLDGIVLGLVILVVPFSLVLGGILRSRLLSTNALSVFGYLVVICLVNGYLFYWPPALPWTREFILVAGCVSFFFFLAFLRVLLRVGHLPSGWGRAYTVLLLLYTVLALGELVGDYELARALRADLRISVYPLVVATLLTGWRRQLRYDWLVWLIAGLLLLQFVVRYVLQWWQLPWQAPAQVLSISSVLPGVLLLVCTLVMEVSRTRVREKRALGELERQQQAEHAKLERLVALRTGQLNDSLRARTSLMARISHDLRSPLVSIIDYARLMRMEAGGDYPQKIERHARQQLELIDELLEFSRSESEQMELILAPGYLYGFLREIEEEGAVLAVRQGNRFEVRLGEDLPSLVRADFRRLRQVLVNLLVNAAKFTRDGHITLEVEGGAGDSAQWVRLRFTLSDTGIGIAASEREHVLQPFSRGRNAGSHPGSGLGLSIVTQMLQRMDSRLELEVPEQGGSRFSFSLQLERATEQDLDNALVESHGLPVDGEGRRILLVDDVEQNREWLGDLLAGYGFEVNGAEHGEQALEALQQAPYDLLISDQMMPVMDGWHLLRHVRQRWARLPVLLYSAAPAQRPPQFPEHLAFDAALLKPASSGELLTQVEALTREAQTRRLTCPL